LEDHHDRIVKLETKAFSVWLKLVQIIFLLQSR
jgi:hypothetical protein